MRLFSQPNNGVAAARNCGMADAQGGFIALIDGDDLWRPEKSVSLDAALVDGSFGRCRLLVV